MGLLAIGLKIYITIIQKWDGIRSSIHPLLRHFRIWLIQKRIDDIEELKNIVVPNGQFSVHYLFPDVGLYEVITRISAKDIAALAPFKVVVPMQRPLIPMVKAAAHSFSITYLLSMAVGLQMQDMWFKIRRGEKAGIV
jgi:hypothetical protein